MKLATIKTTEIYREFTKEKSKQWFSYTEKKFISHIDTFYYSVKTKGDWLMSLSARSLISDLKGLKEVAEEKKEEQPFMEDDAFNDLIVKPFFGFRMYKYSVSKEGCFDIFIADSIPNSITNAIVVQLRSEYIWLRGTSGAFYDSLVYLVGVLDKYGVEIADINENRIDFAYHTNYIQDMLSFFKDENLGQMQVSGFKRWSKEGNFFGDAMYNDYISLGRRKSNSVFIRIYNKSKEVIEMGYKQFFVPLWREQGLISAFDEYIFDKVFEDGNPSWNAKESARCRFYLEHGQDDEHKAMISDLLAREDATADEFKALADGYVPDLTNIVNIEFQTKRKFYYDFVFPPMNYPKWVTLYERRIYTIFYMLQSVRDFLTHTTIRFVKHKGKYSKVRRERRPTADWWLRLAACGELDGISYDLCKDYQCRFDVKYSKYRSLSSLASLSSLLETLGEAGGDDIMLEKDIEGFLSCLNDNDVKRYEKHRRKKKRELRSKFGGEHVSEVPIVQHPKCLTVEQIVQRYLDGVPIDWIVDTVSESGRFTNRSAASDFVKSCIPKYTGIDSVLQPVEPTLSAAQIVSQYEAGASVDALTAMVHSRKLFVKKSYARDYVMNCIRKSKL